MIFIDLVILDGIVLFSKHAHNIMLLIIHYEHLNIEHYVELGVIEEIIIQTEQ